MFHRTFIAFARPEIRARSYHEDHQHFDFSHPRITDLLQLDLSASRLIYEPWLLRVWDWAKRMLCIEYELGDG